MNIRMYYLDFVEEQVLLLPQNYKILSVASRNGYPVLWVMIDESLPKIECVISVVTERANIENIFSFIGTIQDRYNSYYHVFEKLKE